MSCLRRRGPAKRKPHETAQRLFVELTMCSSVTGFVSYFLCRVPHFTPILVIDFTLVMQPSWLFSICQQSAVNYFGLLTMLRLQLLIKTYLAGTQTIRQRVNWRLVSNSPSLFLFPLVFARLRDSCNSRYRKPLFSGDQYQDITTCTDVIQNFKSCTNIWLHHAVPVSISRVLHLIILGPISEANLSATAYMQVSHINHNSVSHRCRK